MDFNCLNFNRRVRSSLILLLTFGAFGSLSCGLQKDPSANIALAVTPDSAYIVPGKGVSCVAAAAAKKDATAVVTADVAGDRVLFSHFNLQWRSADRLTIAGLRVTIYSSGITGADSADGTTVDVPETEIAALIGKADLTIDFAAPGSYSTETNLRNTYENIDSADATKKAGTDYVPCGFQIGSLQSAADIKTYSARLKIEIYGFGTTCGEKDLSSGLCKGGDQYPVRQNVTVRAQKI